MPKVGWLVWGDGRTSDFLGQETGEVEGLVSNGVGREALAWATCEESVVGVFFEKSGGEVGRLFVGGGSDDEFLEVFGVPSGFDKFGGEPVEEFGVGGGLGLHAEVFGCFDDSGAEVLLPEAVDGDAGGEWVVG